MSGTVCPDRDPAIETLNHTYDNLLSPELANVCCRRCGKCPPNSARFCNRHFNCNAADAAAYARGTREEHCRAENCEECWGE